MLDTVGTERVNKGCRVAIFMGKLPHMASAYSGVISMRHL